MSAPAPAAKEDTTTTAAKPKAEEKAEVLELIEEDDEFEEFEGAAWDDAKANDGEEGQLWQDDWDDDDVQDTFTQQLRQQIDAAGQGMTTNS